MLRNINPIDLMRLPLLQESSVQARFEAIAARLGWEQKMLKRTPSSLYFCYKKPLARRELGPLLPPLK